MKCTQEEFKEQIVDFAGHYNIKKKYEFLIEHDELALPEIVKRLGYDLFIQGFSYYDATHQIKEKYLSILSYDKELQKNGFVKFKI